MKRYAGLIGILIMMSFIAPALAQNISFGIIGGANWTDIKLTTDGEEEDVSARRAYGIGGLVSLNMNDMFSIELTPMFVRISNLMDQVDPDPDFDMYYNYLQVPLFFKLKSPGTIRTYIKAGPVVGILLTAEADVEINAIPFTADFSNVMRKLDLGLGFGLGLEIPLWKGNLFVEGRYVFGLNDVLKGGTITLEAGDITFQDELPENSDAKSRSIQVMAGYEFPLFPLRGK